MSWADILDAQLVRLATAATVNDVLALCKVQRDISDERASGFWVGDGDDLLGVLYDAGWQSVDYRATYLWCVRAPDGTLLTYVEGDLYAGNNLMPRED